MNLKIECACGQKIAFEVEPENGAMPCELPCPSCQADITGLANAEIRRQLPAPVAAPPAPAPVARLRVNTGHAAPAPTAGPAAEPPPAVATPPPAHSKPVATALAAAAASAPIKGGDEEASIGSFLMGTVGIFIGTLGGLLVWYLLAKAGMTMRILAILVGVGAGAGARIFCREGDKGLGGVAAVVAVLAMFFGGGITLDKSVTERFTLDDKTLRQVYDDEVKTAKEIVKDIPAGTDAEIKRYLAKVDGDSAEVTAEDVADFRASDEFKQAKDLASGKLSFTTFKQTYHKDFKEATAGAHTAVGAVGAIRMLSLWLIGLVGATAYKLAAG